MKWWERTEHSMSLTYSENYRVFLFHCSVVFECSKRPSKRRAETQACISERNSSSQKSHADIHEIINQYHNTEKSVQMEIRVQRFTESNPFIKEYIRGTELHFQELKCLHFLFRKGPENQNFQEPNGHKIK